MLNIFSSLVLSLLLLQVGGIGGIGGIAGVGGGAAAAPPSWTLTNNKINSACVGSSPCVTPAFTGALTNGSVILACIVGSGTSTHVFSDLAGNTWNDWGPGNVAWSTATETWQCAYTNNTHTTASETCSVTDSGFNSQGMVCFEFTSSAAISRDGASGVGYTSSTGTSTVTITGGTQTTTTNGDLVVLCGTDLSFSTRTIGSGTTLISNTSASAGILCEYQVQGTAGSIALTYAQTTGSSFAYVSTSVAFK